MMRFKNGIKQNKLLICGTINELICTKRKKNTEFRIRTEGIRRHGYNKKERGSWGYGSGLPRLKESFQFSSRKQKAVFCCHGYNNQHSQCLKSSVFMPPSSTTTHQRSLQ